MVPRGPVYLVKQKTAGAGPFALSAIPRGQRALRLLGVRLYRRHDHVWRVVAIAIGLAERGFVALVHRVQ